LSEDISAQLAGFRDGSLLAGYRLERQVGAGGMAVVFRARDERLGRPVALKILSPGLASDSEFRTRFIAESRAAATVDDPHIIPVYEAGEAGGVLFIAMRFVAGGDLRQVLQREGALPPDQAADFVSPVASALDAAHAAGLVHRDVKPGNILVDTGPGRPDHVYLSDFGIAKGALSINVTAVGSYIGTPDYMAPEQISGRSVDGRTDQYSLACVAFQLLTGALPFQRDQLPAVIYAQLSAPPPLLTWLRPDLPAAVDQVVAKAMAKTAEKRYESCGDFADALREALGLTSYRRSSVTAPPSSPPILPPPTAPSDALAGLTTDPGPRGGVTPVQTPEPALASQTPGTAVPAPAGLPDQPSAPTPGDLPHSGTGPAESPPPAAAAATAAMPMAPPAGPDGAPPGQHPSRRRGPVPAWVMRHRLPVFGLACAVLAAAIAIPLVSPGPSASSGRSASSGAAATPVGWVSLGNLSQTPSPVDVYLYSSGDSSPRFVQHDVAYGTILPYRAVSPGNYSVRMRTAGSPASSNPAWSVSFTVKAGGTYTVAPLRTSAEQGQLKVIDNNLTTPKGKSFVRVIQADIDQKQVTFHCSCAPGAPGNITTDAAPGSVSPPVPIPTGTWTMTATGPKAKASLPIRLTAGTVHTEIVIAAPGGGIQIINVVTATRARQAPGGGASAGSAGTSVSYRRVAVGLPPAWRFVPIAAVAFSPSGGTLAIASEKICLWDIAAARCTGIFGSASITALAFSPDGKILAASDNTGHTYLWNLATGSQGAILSDSGSSGAFSVAFSPDGKTLAAGDGSGRTYLFNADTGKPTGSLPDPGSTGVNSVTFSPDGKILAVGDGNGHAYLWNVATGKPIVTLGNSGSKSVMSVAFSPDGKILAAGNGNGRTYLWNAATGKPVASLPDPSSKGVISVAFSPDDMTMAAGDNNGNIYIWNIVTGKLITTLSGPVSAEINSVAFSADGKILATGDEDGGVFLWYRNLSGITGRADRGDPWPAFCSHADPTWARGCRLPALASGMTGFSAIPDDCFWIMYTVGTETIGLLLRNAASTVITLPLSLSWPASARSRTISP
jgi:serine/threonine protein kinase/WD40 repeat protein